MAHIVFHGPNGSKECAKVVKALAKELGGKYSYTSFYNGRPGRKNWHSPNTVGKAAYSLRGVPLHVSKWQPNPTDRKKAAAIARRLRKIKDHGLVFRFIS